MSSNENNNITVINVENDATIPNQSREEEEIEGNRQGLTIFDPEYFFNLPPPPAPENENEKHILIFFACYLLYGIVSLFYGLFNIFPILFPISLCSGISAFVGRKNKDFQLLIPFMITALFNAICAWLCFLYMLIDVNSNLSKSLYDYWPEKAEKFIQVRSDYYFYLYLSMLMVTHVFEIIITVETVEHHDKIEEKCGEESNRKYGEKIMKEYLENLQQRGLVLVQHQRLRNVSNQQRERPNPYAELLHQYPPPPSYESIIIPQNPQNGLPPPDYSMLEREEHNYEMASSLSASRESIHDELSDTSSEETSDSSDASSSSNNDTNASTAMSPSSVLN